MPFYKGISDVVCVDGPLDGERTMQMPPKFLIGEGILQLDPRPDDWEGDWEEDRNPALYRIDGQDLKAAQAAAAVGMGSLPSIRCHFIGYKKEGTEAPAPGWDWDGFRKWCEEGSRKEISDEGYQELRTVLEASRELGERIIKNDITDPVWRRWLNKNARRAKFYTKIAMDWEKIRLDPSSWFDLVCMGSDWNPADPENLKRSGT